MDVFVERLIALKEALGMDDKEFASYLGVNRSIWSQVRRGVLRASASFVGRVVLTRPELMRYLPTERKEEVPAA